MNPRTEIAYCRDHGITVIWLEESGRPVCRGDGGACAGVAGTGGDGIYLSVDVDSLDAAYAPGTCVPPRG